jgi:hypothetical protein
MLLFGQHFLFTIPIGTDWALSPLSLSLLQTPCAYLYYSTAFSPPQSEATHITPLCLISLSVNCVL